MSEEELNKLKEFVFRDIRYDESETEGYKKEVRTALENHKTDPVQKVTEYQWIMGVKYKHSYPDAERWKIALETYKKKYPCFKGNEYNILNNYIHYEKHYEKDVFSVDISADTLTGPSMIINPARELGLINHEAIKAFCCVAYTVGNACPVMKNPRCGSDTCWYKLENFHDARPHRIHTGTLKFGWDNNVPTRKANNMFAVFPENLSGRVIVNKLMLNDYYDKDYNLFLTHKPQYYADKARTQGDEVFIIFVRQVTSLIIKRGIRIYCENDLKSIGLDAKGALDKLAEELRKEL